jgi:hypothetical protein
MTKIHKHQILESLNSMDQTQMEKVLNYVRSIAQQSSAETAYERFKKNAMKEIRQALEKK